MLRLLEAWLHAGVLEGTMLVHPTVGTAQGAAIPPLMANVYLSPFWTGFGRIASADWGSW
jgi:hypothetical protein